MNRMFSIELRGSVIAIRVAVCGTLLARTSSTDLPANLGPVPDGSLTTDATAYAGMNIEVNSHAFLYLRRLDTFDSLGTYVERTISDNGPVASSTLFGVAYIRARADSAKISSDSADTNGVNKETLPNNCHLNFHYTR